jgi:hypothetical protein
MVGFRILPEEWMLNWQKERKRNELYDFVSDF